MYLGRQNLPEAWRMPQRWENDTAELVLEELDSVRLVLSYRGLNLLSNSFEPFFLCVQVCSPERSMCACSMILNNCRKQSVGLGFVGILTLVPAA